MSDINVGDWCQAAKPLNFTNHLVKANSLVRIDGPDPDGRPGVMNLETYGPCFLKFLKRCFIQPGDRVVMEKPDSQRHGEKGTVDKLGVYPNGDLTALITFDSGWHAEIFAKFLLKSLRTAVKKGPETCTCDIVDLMKTGCVCGFLLYERSKPKG